MLVVVLMILRLIFNYQDPNPFSFIGKNSIRLKKVTDRIVYPSAGLLAQYAYGHATRAANYDSRRDRGRLFYAPAFLDLIFYD